MPRRHLKDWIQGYLEYTQYSEAPESFHFWTAVGTIAGALQRKVYICELYYQWTPNFYTILVAPPGVATKSTTLGVGEKLLVETRKARIGPNALTWQALITSLANSTQTVLMPTGKPFPMSCLTFYSSELGSLLDIHDRKMIDVLVDLWDGKLGDWTKETKTMGGDRIINPWLNIMAGTTPAWLLDNVPKQLLEGGFMARCIFVHAAKKRRLVAYPSQEVKDRDRLDQLRADLVHDLELIATLKGEYRLTPEVYEYGRVWYEAHNNRPDAMDHGGFLVRKQTHIHKLAMVLAAAKRDDLIVTIDEFVAAEKLLTAVENEHRNVFQLISTTPEMEGARLIVEQVQREGEIRADQLYRKIGFNRMSYRDFESSVEAAVRACHITTEIRGTALWLKTL